MVSSPFDDNRKRVRLIYNRTLFLICDDKNIKTRILKKAGTLSEFTDIRRPAFFISDKFLNFGLNESVFDVFTFKSFDE